MSHFSPAHAPNFRMHYEVVDGVLPHDTLFIHGNLASNRWWKPALSEWKQMASTTGFKGRAVMAEWRGCGQSSAPGSLQEVNMLDFAKDYIALAEHLGLNRVDLVGHSTGGIIAALIASEQPELVRSMFLLDPVGARGVVFHDGMYEAFEQMKANQELTAQVIGSTIYGNDFESDFFKNEIAIDAFNAVDAVGVWVIESLADFDVTERLKRVQSPALVVHGSEDKTLPVEDSRHLAEILPNGRFELWDGCGHCANVEDPSRFAKAVAEFFTAV